MSMRPTLHSEIKIITAKLYLVLGENNENKTLVSEKRGLTLYIWDTYMAASCMIGIWFTLLKSGFQIWSLAKMAWKVRV